jgi:hypothetical protein
VENTVVNILVCILIELVEDASACFEILKNYKYIQNFSHETSDSDATWDAWA